MKVWLFSDKSGELLFAGVEEGGSDGVCGLPGAQGAVGLIAL